jgi:hypothetical protein
LLLIKIFGFLAEKVKRQLITEKATFIKKDYQRDGIYFAVVNDGENEWRGKVVVE